MKEEEDRKVKEEGRKRSGRMEKAEREEGKNFKGEGWKRSVINCCGE